MTLHFEPWQLVAVCLLTIIGAAVVAIVLVGLLGAWLFRDRGSVPVALADDDEADDRSNVLPYRDPRHNPLTCRECLGAEKGSF